MRAIYFTPLVIAIFTPALGAQPRIDALGDSLPPGAVARLGTMRFKHAPGNYIIGAVYSADGKQIATRGKTGGVWVWDAATGKQLHRFAARMGLARQGQGQGAAIRPGGNLRAEGRRAGGAGRRRRLPARR
jgi:hypothetical protein